MLAFILILSPLSTPEAMGQAPFLSQEQIQRLREQKLEQEAIQALEARSELGQRFLYDFGGWSRSYVMAFDSLNNAGTRDKTRVLKSEDLRLWSMVNVDGVQTLYFRGKMEYLDWNRGSQFRRRENDLNVEIDQGFYTLHLGKAIKRYLKKDVPFSLKATGGQFFATIGNGLSYSRVGIGGEVKGRTRYVDFKAFWFRTIPGEDNIDFSAPGFRTKGQTRDFIGAQITYPRLFNNHNPYFYYLDQRDRSDYFKGTAQKYGYDSQYFGIGSNGTIIRNLTYAIEGVREIGKGYVDITKVTGSPQIRQDVRAWALDVQLKNIFEVLTHPRVSVQYALGTGDKDRRLVTTTRFGNANNRDRNFLYFGYIDTGYAVSPRLSNLQMLRFGLSMNPLEFTEGYKKSLELGVNFYTFHKYTRTGGISDFRANRNLGSLGKEVDAYINWNVTSDVFVNVNYGRFFPSNAYSDTKARDFVLASFEVQF